MKCRGSLVKPKHITRPFYFIFIFYFFKIIICRIYISQISNDDAGHNVSSSFSPKLFRFFYFSGSLTCPSRRATIVNRLSHLRNVFLCVCVCDKNQQNTIVPSVRRFPASAAFAYYLPSFSSSVFFLFYSGWFRLFSVPPLNDVRNSCRCLQETRPLFHLNQRCGGGRPSPFKRRKHLEMGKDFSALWMPSRTHAWTPQ